MTLHQLSSSSSLWPRLCSVLHARQKTALDAKHVLFLNQGCAVRAIKWILEDTFYHTFGLEHWRVRNHTESLSINSRAKI